MRLLCLSETIDLETVLGRCTYRIRNACAALGRELIIERTIAGMQAARKRGKI